MKNAIIYRITDGLPVLAESLSRLLDKSRFMPCPTLSMSSSGWILPAGHSTSMAHQVGQYIAISMQTESKILPRSVIVRATNERAAQIERAEGWRVGHKERKEIAESVTLDLLPKAFTKIDRVNAYIDIGNARLMVDTASTARAEGLLSLFLDSVDGIGVDSFRVAKRPSQIMASWICGQTPDCITIDDEATLVRDDETKKTVKYQNHNLDTVDILNHLGDGKLPTRLAVTYNDRVSFSITDKLQIKRISLTYSIKQISDEQYKGEVFDADVALFCGEMAEAINAIEAEMGGPSE